ncbi:MAG: hypothetical protein K2X99_02655 [Gemmatimonadaceae bacterium]|nr:hypothetical protein [Gemmatimonadaceae bacterium]
MDSVPGLCFVGVRLGSIFDNRFPMLACVFCRNHSHSGLQEQLRHYGPPTVDPLESQGHAFDCGFVFVLSDRAFDSPYRLLPRRKQPSDAYDDQRRSIADLFRDVVRDGSGAPTLEHAAMGHAAPATTASIATDLLADHDMSVLGATPAAATLRGPSAARPVVSRGVESPDVGDAMTPRTTRRRLAESSVRLREDGCRVLVHPHLHAPRARPDVKAPSREIELHVTGKWNASCGGSAACLSSTRSRSSSPTANACASPWSTRQG